MKQEDTVVGYMGSIAFIWLLCLLRAENDVC